MAFLLEEPEKEHPSLEPTRIGMFGTYPFARLRYCNEQSTWIGINLAVHYLPGYRISAEHTGVTGNAFTVRLEHGHAFLQHQSPRRPQYLSSQEEWQIPS